MNNAKKNLNISLANLGCPKNQVDAEVMLGILHKKGYKINLNEEEADVIIVNTCSFIIDAEKESVKTIVDIIDEGKKVIITGCLVQKHREELQEAVPEALAYLGPGDIDKIGDVLDKITENNSNQKSYYQVSDNPNNTYNEETRRFQFTAGPSSYLKIAEGCDYSCAYCIIPQLRGKYRSRTIESIVEEAKLLGEDGVSEIVLVAQDSTRYGMDLYKKPSLGKLLQELNKIETISWIRLMYAYPSFLDNELLKIIADSDKIVNYIDIPLQHSHSDILKRMNRPAFDYSEIIYNVKDIIPNASIRTAFIVGFPGETDEHFEHLYNFVKDHKFDKLGVFEYSKEKNTSSYSLDGHVSAAIKDQRRNDIMQLQQGISTEINKALIGQTLESIVEYTTPDGQIIGRTYRDAPDIDGLINISSNERILSGDIIPVKITGSSEYDLFGTY